MNKYYTLNTTTPAINKFLLVLVGCLAVFVLGFIHGLITAVNPIIYLGIIVTIGFGIGFAIIYRILSKLTKVRDKQFILFSGVLVTFLGLYFSWSAYALYLAEATEAYMPTLGLLLDPLWLFGVIESLYINGSWGLGMSNPLIVTGPLLAIIWLAEIAIVLFLVFKTLREYQLGPFHESSQKWFVKYTLDVEFQSLPNAAVFYEMEETSILEKI